MDKLSHIISELPEGYVMIAIPKSHAVRYFLRIDWDTIEEPSIKDISNYLGVSIAKIKEDLKNPECPLKVYSKGKKGRGSSTTFFKNSVELYKEYLTNQKK